MNEKLTKNQRREQAREQARLAREAEKKREKRNRLFLQGGIALVIIAVLGVVALVLSQSMKPAGPGPVSYTHLDVYKRQVYARAASPYRAYTLQKGRGGGNPGICRNCAGHNHSSHCLRKQTSH